MSSLEAKVKGNHAALADLDREMRDSLECVRREGALGLSALSGTMEERLRSARGEIEDSSRAASKAAEAQLGDMQRELEAAIDGVRVAGGADSDTVLLNQSLASISCSLQCTLPSLCDGFLPVHGFAQ